MLLFYLDTSIINAYNHFCGVYMYAFTYKILIYVTELGKRHIKLIITKALDKNMGISVIHRKFCRYK